MLWFQFTNIGTIEFGKLLQACTNVNLTAAQFLKITFTTKLNLDQSFKINFDVDLRRSDINQKAKRHKLHRNKCYKIRHPQYESLKFKPHISFVFLAILCTLGTCVFVVCNVFLQTKSRILQEFQQLKIFDRKIFFAIFYVTGLWRSSCPAPGQILCNAQRMLKYLSKLIFCIFDINIRFFNKDKQLKT